MLIHHLDRDKFIGFI